jgi:altronate hydrolase
MLCGPLVGYITHPNGGLSLSLGCQNAQATMLQDELVARPSTQRPPTSSTSNRWHRGAANQHGPVVQIFAGLMLVNEARRTPALPPAEHRSGSAAGSTFLRYFGQPGPGHVSTCWWRWAARLFGRVPELCGVIYRAVRRLPLPSGSAAR